MTDRVQESSANAKYEYYDKDPSDTLFSVAYDFSPAGASKESIARCMANIQDKNDFDFENKDVLKIPVPCDPGDKKFDLKEEAKELSTVFKDSSPQNAATALSEKLVGLVDTLDTNDRTYNKLMVELYENLKNENSYSNISTEGWNNKTHTWNKAFVYGPDFPRTPPVPIIQRGNTVESIVNDRLQQLQQQGVHTFKQLYTQDVLRMNGISDPRKLQVGKPLFLPY